MGISKVGMTHILRIYEEFLSVIRNDPLVLFELGIANGDSLLYWQDFLPNTKIVGLDVHPVQLNDACPRIKIYQGEQQDRALLDRIARNEAPDKYDIIIDDASHVGQFTRISFWHLFRNYLKPGGLYFIEDWGCSFFDTFVDGKKYRPRDVDFAWHEKALNALKDAPLVQRVSLLRRAVGYLRWHGVQRVFPSCQRGMVGFVKELVDECGATDMTDDALGGLGPKRPSSIEWMRISVGMVIVKKR